MYTTTLLPAGILLAGAAALSASAAPSGQQLERQMLTHVEKVLVIDSINVDRDGFFSHYRMQPSAGAILPGEEIARRLGKAVKTPGLEGEPLTGFTNEFEDYMVWAQEDTTGYLRLAESVRLGDGSWSTPRPAPAVLNFGTEPDDEDDPVEANAAFPFMLDDGQTLYFASDNGQSLGGYDIFVATKDPSDGEFLIPGNLGMPFNSPYDDYMMALDRQTGIGWWASDRNRLEDSITIYIYALSDERVNVDPDDENLQAYATLAGWRELLDEEQLARRDELLALLAAIKPSDSRAPEFTLPMPGGKTYRFLSDFKNRKAASQMQLYIAQKERLDNKEKELASLRASYAKGDTKLGARIQSMEQQLRADGEALRALLSEIYKLETNR